MQAAADGSTSSRAGAIWFPHRTQRPYVPAEMRLSAAVIWSTARRWDALAW